MKAILKDFYYENGGKGTVIGITLETEDGETFKYNAEADFDQWCYMNEIPENLDKEDERFEEVEEWNFGEEYERANEEYRYKTFEENVEQFDKETWNELLQDLIEKAKEDDLTFDEKKLEENCKYW